MGSHNQAAKKKKKAEMITVLSQLFLSFSSDSMLVCQLSPAGFQNPKPES